MVYYLVNYTHQATTDGGSGTSGQWSSENFSADAGSYGFTLDCGDDVLSYGVAIAGGFGTDDKNAHAYIIFTF